MVNSDVVPYYTYPIDIIRRSIQLVTRALTSLRGAMKCLQIFSDICPFSTPSHTAIQNWILQYGLHELTSPIQHRSDWIFILDHTIEFGAQKCLLILGITQEELMKRNEAISHDQVRVLTIDISEKSSGEKIHVTLEMLIEKTGIPVQMVSDGGSDLKKAIGLTCRKHGSIRATYDITHKCGLILKGFLERDMRWRRFLDKYTYTKRKSVHSRFAFIAPKKLKDKSRWMNLDTTMDWATKVIEFKDAISQGTNGVQGNRSFTKALDQTFGWIDDFRDSIREWNCVLNIISIVRDEVKTNGLRADSLQRFNEKVQNLHLATGQAQTLIPQLQSFLQQQTDGISSTQKYLGTSDIIESVFAKYKNFSARTPMKGVGKAVLTMPVFLSTVTTEKVAAALKKTSTKKVTQWLSNNIGESIFAQRMKAFRICAKPA